MYYRHTLSPRDIKRRVTILDRLACLILGHNKQIYILSSGLIDGSHYTASQVFCIRCAKQLKG